MMVLRSGVGLFRLDGLTFAPGGTVLAAPASAEGVMLWTAFTNGAKARVVKVPIPGVQRVAFAPDGATLYAGNDQLCALDLATRTAERLPIVPWHALWFGVVPDGSQLIVSEQNRAGTGCRITGWAVGEHRKPVWKTTIRGQVWSPPLFAPKGDRFLFCEHRRAARQWHAHRVTRAVTTGAELDASAPLADLPKRTILSPDGRKLACCTREAIRIYPATGTWKKVPTITSDNRMPFMGVAFHPSGRYLAVTSFDRTVKFYDTTTWKVARTFDWGTGRMWCIAFSPDGTLAAAGSDRGKVVVWDVDL
jgi:WD40 repeat protein